MPTPLLPEDNQPVTIKQGTGGDCYILASLDCILQSTAGRRKLRSMFTIDPIDGSIIVRIKQIPSIHGNLLANIPALEEKGYIYNSVRIDNVDYDEFTLPPRRIAEIDHPNAGSQTSDHSNSLIVKVFSRLSSYYYKAQLAGNDMTASIVAHNNLAARYPESPCQFVSDIVGIPVIDYKHKAPPLVDDWNNYPVYNLDSVIRLKKLNPDLPIYIAMRYGQKDASGQLHSYHALRIKSIIFCPNRQDNSYDLELVNPWDNSKVEILEYRDIQNKNPNFAVFMASPLEELTVMLDNMRNTVSGYGLGKRVFGNPPLRKLLCSLKAICKNTLTADKLPLIEILYNRFPQLGLFFDSLKETPEKADEDDDLENINKRLIANAILAANGNLDTFIDQLLTNQTLQIKIAQAAIINNNALDDFIDYILSHGIYRAKLFHAILQAHGLLDALLDYMLKNKRFQLKITGALSPGELNDIKPAILNKIANLAFQNADKTIYNILIQNDFDFLSYILHSAEDKSLLLNTILKFETIDGRLNFPYLIRLANYAMENRLADVDYRLFFNLFMQQAVLRVRRQQSSDELLKAELQAGLQIARYCFNPTRTDLLINKELCQIINNNLVNVHQIIDGLLPNLWLLGGLIEFIKSNQSDAMLDRFSLGPEVVNWHSDNYPTIHRLLMQNIENCYSLQFFMNLYTINDRNPALVEQIIKVAALSTPQADLLKIIDLAQPSPFKQWYIEKCTKHHIYKLPTATFQALIAGKQNESGYFLVIPPVFDESILPSIRQWEEERLKEIYRIYYPFVDAIPRQDQANGLNLFFSLESSYVAACQKVKKHSSALQVEFFQRVLLEKIQNFQFSFKNCISIQSLITVKDQIFQALERQISLANMPRDPRLIDVYQKKYAEKYQEITQTFETLAKEHILNRINTEVLNVYTFAFTDSIESINSVEKTFINKLDAIEAEAAFLQSEIPFTLQARIEISASAEAKRDRMGHHFGGANVLSRF